MSKPIFAAAAAALCLAAAGDVLTVAKPPAVDGVLDEESWTKAKWESGFRRFRDDVLGRQPAVQTAFAILADADCIYLGIKAEHPNMAAVKASGRQSLWTAESVEFNVVPDGGNFSFYKFLVTFQGDIHASFYSESGSIQPDPYHPAWEAKSAETATGWTAEARIPLSAFYMTRSGEWKRKWRLNVGRNCREAGRGSPFSCWADAKGFADLKNFKEISGFPVRRRSEDIWMKSVVADVRRLDGGKPSGSMKFVVYAAQGGRFRLETTFSATQEVDLKTNDTAFEVPASFPGNGRFPMSVRLVRTADGRPCERIWPIIVDYSPIRIKMTSPAYRGNFYPGQKPDRVAGVASAMAGGPVRVVLEGPGFGRRETIAGEDGSFSFDTTGFEYGAATLTVSAGGDSLERKIRRLKPLPEGRHATWVENGNLVVDGKPVFRRNMYAEYYMGGAAFRKRYDADNLHMTRDIRALGTFEPARLVKGAGREAMKDVKPGKEIFAAVDKVLKGAQSSSGAYYYISDEPECRDISPIYLKWIYDYVAERDPYHVLLMCSRAGEKYIDCADWFETHPYVSPHYSEGKRTYGREFSVIGNNEDEFRPEAHPDKCVGGTPQCFSYPGGDYPTLDEYLLNVWCELVRGIRTIYPYAYHDLGDRAALYEGTRYIFSSIEALEDIFLFAERRTLLKTAECECALWTAKDGERLFALVNFTESPVEVKVPGLKGSFREFRGGRTFKSGFFSDAIAFSLAPHEVVVGSTGCRGKNLPTLAETRQLVKRLEDERLSRDNQLLNRHLDVEIATSNARSPARKLFDGVRDFLAWGPPWKKGGSFIELSFPKFTPVFKSVAVYGINLEGMRVLVRRDGDWQDLGASSTNALENGVRLDCAEKASAVRLRFEFPKLAEIYEIELPRVPGEPPREKREAAPYTMPKAEGVSWSLDVPAGSPTGLWWKVSRSASQKFLVFDFREPRRLVDGRYTRWDMVLEKTAGHLAGNVTKVFPGLYTLRLPDPGATSADRLRIWNYNLALDMGPIVCAERPADYAEFLDYGDRWRIEVVLSSPCEDMVCSFISDVGGGPFTYVVNGRSDAVMKPVDGTRRKWAAEIKVPPGHEKENRSRKNGSPARPCAKITVLGGALDRPIYTNALKAS